MTKQEAVRILGLNKERLKEFQISTLSLFGSVVRDEATRESDIDIPVEFNEDAPIGLFELVRLKSYLSEILNAEADLVTLDALHPMLRDDIMREAIRAA